MQVIRYVIRASAINPHDLGVRDIIQLLSDITVEIILDPLAVH